MLIVWSLSVVASVFTFILGVSKKSWVLMLISAVTFLPIAYYFSGARNAWEYVSLTPIILLALSIIFWFLQRSKKYENNRTTN